MSLHVDRYEYAGTDGSGAALLLIHGWGMHGGMWSGVAQRLAQNFSVMAVDLPGHGHSADHSRSPFPDTQRTLDAIVDELSVLFNAPLAICGWSLGGQIALRWAMRYPKQVSHLVTVASTPSFVQREGWDHALSVEILQEFADSLEHHYALTLKRFLALQVRGSEQERDWLAVLRDGLFSRGEPDLLALQAGLEILRLCDLCSVLPDVNQPTLVLAGERDTLIPLQASQYIANNTQNGRLEVISGAAHVPFLSHPEEFARHVVNFLNEKRT
jgi:pimeloyl-[acyl-carrier protein] methyl ester esterase